MVHVLNEQRDMVEIAMTRKFASLHNHTYYSLLDSTVSPDELVQQAYDLGFKAVAVTEHGNAHSFVEAYKKAQELGIKLIVGCEVYETTFMDYKEPDADRYHLILLAKSDKGMKNLFKIISEGHTRGFYGKPRIDIHLLSQYSEDIICMSSCLGGRINRTMGYEEVTSENFEKAVSYVYKYKSVFGDNFYLEMQSHATNEQMWANRNLLKLARETNTKFTITFDTHIKDDSELQQDIHRKFIKIGQDREVGETYEGCWQQDLETIHKTMDAHVGWEAVEEGIETTDALSDLCNVNIQLHQDLMPVIKIPEGFDGEKEYLKHLVNEGWVNRGLHRLPKDKIKVYKERIKNEMEVLDYLGYNSYFIMLQQLFAKFHERKIPLGYGRGSAGGCLTLYVLGVTEVDSIRWDLDFSRFANKGRRGSPADVDIDISKRRRQEALEVAIELFGEQNVAQLCTFNSLSPKVAIRDLGKVFDEEGICKIPYSIRDKISKLIPDDPNEKMTLERALESSDELKQWQEKYPLLFEYAKHLQNLPKSVGTHAAAVIISPRPVVEFGPVMLNGDKNVMMQLEMHNAMDDLGLVKMDFLGLKTLDVIDDTLRLSGMTWEDVDINKLDLEDNEVYQSIYGAGDTFGVFQMETFVPQRMFAEMKPDITIEDVFAVNAMNRPAILSVGMDKVYLYGKKNPDKITYIHPDIEPIFKPTNGIMLYQEQALKVFGVAGFDETEQDVARRAIGKKKAETMAKLYTDFQKGLHSRGWTDSQVEEIWKLVEAQSGYSFNKSHCVEYGLLSYLTAYLSYHHRVEFMTALLSSVEGDYPKLSKYIQICRQMGIKVLAPDINKSGKEFTIDNGNILFGLLSIKGVGESAVQTILTERENHLFYNLSDCLSRVHLGTSTIVALIQSGAFGGNKDELLFDYCRLSFDRKPYKPVKTIPKKAILMELGLISTDKEFKDKELCTKRYNYYKEQLHEQKQKDKWDKHTSQFMTKYMIYPEMYEYKTLSIFLNGHPFDNYVEWFPSYEEYEDGAEVVIGGTISNVRYRKQRDGRRMADIDVLTLYGIVECRIFAQKYETYQDLIKKGNNVVTLAKKSGSQYLIDKMRSLQNWKERRLPKLLEKRR